MLQLITSSLKKIASPVDFWLERIRNEFGITCHPKESEFPLDPNILQQTYSILGVMGPKLVKACEVKDLYFSMTMGRSLAFTPNHGYYLPSDKTITLNSDIFIHPDEPADFFDQGYFLPRPIQTLIHEYGHALDAVLGEPSLRGPWLCLSGWSEIPKPGLKRLRIKEDGQDDIVGEWLFDPSAGFTRFYGKRNPWDDFADCFSYYIFGMKGKLPQNKLDYFDKLMRPYIKN